LRAQNADVIIAFGGGNLTADRRIVREALNVSLLVSKYEGWFAYPAHTEPVLHKPVALGYPIRVRRRDGSQGYIVASSNFVQFIGMMNVTIDAVSKKVVAVQGSPV
ncbi:unnamed protein product, partial [Ixodes hexagonus]